MADSMDQTLPDNDDEAAADIARARASSDQTIADDPAHEPAPAGLTTANDLSGTFDDASHGPARSLTEWMTVEAADNSDTEVCSTKELSIDATLIGEGGAAASMRDETAMTADDARRDWGAVSEGGAASAGTSVQVADFRTGRTVGLDVAMRPGRLAFAGNDAVGDDFSIVSRLGRGGMGVVFRARQLSLGREVAVKVILPDQAESERARSKFIAEAVITGGLDHPNIVPLHELGVTSEGLPFYAMKEVEGTPWSNVVHEKTESENIAILMAVADAVAFAHDRGVIHRDLKPDNVMLGQYGEVLLMDWGLAVPHYPDADGRRVPKGRGGTPAYLAPEMARADDALIGPTSDIYLLGAILYEICSGHPPHAGLDVFSCIAAAANNTIEPTDRDDELVAIARKAMATRPEDRYATVKDFQAALTDFRRHEESLRVAAHAREQLERARASGAYDDFNRALFGFEESLALWNGNAGARDGLGDTRLALAREALKRGDSDLALTTVADAAGNDFDRVRAEATTQKREHEARAARVRRWRMAAGVLVAVVILVLSVATAWVNEARVSAVEARDDAQRSEAVAVKARKETEEALERETAMRKDKEKALASETAMRKEKEEALDHATAARKEKEAAEAREAVEREAKEKAKDAELAALREKEAERALREDAQSAARRSEDLLARAGYLEDSERWKFDAAEARRRQEAAATQANRPARLALALPAGASLAFLCVPPGEFVMGSSTKEAGRSADEYLHPVTITRAFWLEETPLTRGQWRALVPVEAQEDLAGGGLRELLTGEDGANAWEWRTRPLEPGEGDLPAIGISPRDVRDLLLPKLSALAPEGMIFRLPTEAEWEYACRAGTPTPYHTGAGKADGLRAAWLDENAGGLPQPVGLREANAWGFFDMHGNVHEIVADYYNPVFALTAFATREDPLNPAPHEGRPLHVIRGGSHISTPAASRAAKRETLHAENRHDDVGVRMALVMK